jgi:hypothetical protein
MGMTMQQLGNDMTAQEFAQHYALECEEPMPPAQRGLFASVLAALANGPLTPPSKGSLWAAHHFMPALWADLRDEDNTPAQPEALTIEQIMARARNAGMVH